ncbi:E3 ubiquitin-protein ligase TRIM56 [Holothuria leucospilota]|uniref:E3 ubiquitin-protein ligase TRIM56 n=1 Tax=Holothuria leucospilota TaxID=206669 RepID=A0A9Q0Y998_HOLLE|nr:E3 ubiquitin-protein ligase TRIM56 [Holothuria leucospilota]
MASGSSIVKNMDEKFCYCPICLEQFKEPKLLPCLHRFCCDCLQKVIGQAQGVLICPECRQECDIPTKGADGFKTDFYMKNIIDFVELQKSMQECHIRECFSCSKSKKMSTYCFKCNDFLCEECHNHHVTSKMMKDHRPHVLSLEDVESRNISLEKLMSLKDVPRCQIHPENVSQLCCTSCQNIPICLACSFGKHKDHSIYEVVSLAITERDRLTEKLDDLRKCKERLDMMSAEVTQIKEKMIFNAKEETEKFQAKRDDKMKDIERTKTKIREQINVQISDVKANSDKRKNSLQEMMDKEIQEITGKYDKLFEEAERKTEASLKELQEKLVDKESRLDGKLAYLNQKSSYILKSIGMKEETKRKTITRVQQHLENVNKRYDNLTTTATSIISAKNDWTAVNCISDIIPAIDPLIEDVKREFPELDKLEVFGIDINCSYVNLDVADCVNLTEKEERVIEIKGFPSKQFEIWGVIPGEGENIVITGNTGEEKHFHSVLNQEGKVLLHHSYQDTNEECHRILTNLSKFKVSVACNNRTGVVSFLNGRNGSYIEKTLKDVLPSWTEDRKFVCIDVDLFNDRLYFADKDGDHKFVFVVDYQLELCHTLQLPEVIKGFVLITTLEDKLLVSELEKSCVHVLTVEGELLQVLKSPLEGKWTPIVVSMDKHGFIYILWGREATEKKQDKATDHGKGRDDTRMDKAKMVIIQYMQDFSRVLAIRPFERNAYVMTVMDTSKGEKLLVAAESSDKIYVYGLESTDLNQ